MVILGKLIKGNFWKKGDEYVLALDGDYDKGIKDSVLDLLPSTIDIFNGNYKLTVNVVLEEVKTTSSTSYSNNTSEQKVTTE